MKLSKLKSFTETYMSSGAIQDISAAELCRLLGEKDLGLDLLVPSAQAALKGRVLGHLLCGSSLGS